MKHFRSSITAALVALCACSEAQEALDEEAPQEDEQLQIGEMVDARIRENWIGHELGISAKQWRVHARLNPSPESTGSQVVPGGAKRALVVEDTDERFVIGDPASGLVFAPAFDEDELSLVAAELESLGYAEASLETSAEQELGFRGYTGGVDTRTPRGLFEFGLGVDVYNQIGKVTSGCSGTFIGTPESNYYVITASHCFWSADGTYRNPDFQPRRDGCEKPDGTPLSRGCDTTPYGTWTGGQFMMSQYYIDNCTTQAGTLANLNACRANDIAVMRVTRPSGVAFPGAMGFGYWNMTDLDNAVLYTRGYPGCGAAPATCRNNTLMGDVADCSVPAGLFPDAQGWYRVLRHGCDATAGDSGAPLYRYLGGQKVTGVHTLGNGGGTGPNSFRRITPQFYTWTLNFMGI